MVAKGKTRFTIYQNIIASVILVPLLFWWTTRFGAIGASFVWLSVNAGYVLISIPIFHRLFLRGELESWYKKDVALPFFASGILVAAAKYVQAQMFADISIPYLGYCYFLLLSPM